MMIINMKYSMRLLNEYCIHAVTNIYLIDQKEINTLSFMS